MQKSWLPDLLPAWVFQVEQSFQIGVNWSRFALYGEVYEIRRF
jgi:hypothetical protein